MQIHVRVFTYKKYSQVSNNSTYIFVYCHILMKMVCIALNCLILFFFDGHIFGGFIS